MLGQPIAISVPNDEKYKYLAKLLLYVYDLGYKIPGYRTAVKNLDDAMRFIKVHEFDVVARELSVKVSDIYFDVSGYNTRFGDNAADKALKLEPKLLTT